MKVRPPTKHVTTRYPKTKYINQNAEGHNIHKYKVTSKGINTKYFKHKLS